MKMLLKKLGQLSSEYLDRFSGARRADLYYNPNGVFSRLIERLPQLQQKYRPTPWLANAHAHILYFDLIKKRTIKLKYDALEQLKSVRWWNYRYCLVWTGSSGKYADHCLTSYYYRFS